MTKLIIKWLIFAGIIMATCYLPGIKVDGFEWALLIAAVLTLVNIFIKPLLKLVTFPINMMTLGLFNFVINFAILYAVAYFIPNYHINSIAGGFAASVVIAAAYSVLKWI